MPANIIQCGDIATYPEFRKEYVAMYVPAFSFVSILSGSWLWSGGTWVNQQWEDGKRNYRKFLPIDRSKAA